MVQLAPALGSEGSQGRIELGPQPLPPVGAQSPLQQTWLDPTEAEPSKTGLTGLLGRQQPEPLYLEAVPR